MSYRKEALATEMSKIDLEAFFKTTDFRVRGGNRYTVHLDLENGYHVSVMLEGTKRRQFEMMFRRNDGDHRENLSPQERARFGYDPDDGLVRYIPNNGLAVLAAHLEQFKQ